MLTKIFHILFSSFASSFEDVRQQQHNNQLEQRRLFLYYQYLKNQGLPLPSFRDTGFRTYSQNDEDGLLLYIFSLIGFTNRTCIDMAFGSPYGANTTNLICNWGFHGLLVEGNSEPTTFFETHKDTCIYPPLIRKAWITAENVNELCLANGFEDEIDLFSLDMDGVDYWVWKALDAVSPRVVVVEYQDVLGSEKSLAVPYRPDFNRFDIDEHFFSASLLAFVTLARTKGYRLVGVNSYGFNAFFVKDGLANDLLPEISINECFNRPKVIQGMKELHDKIITLPWIEV